MKKITAFILSFFLLSLFNLPAQAQVSASTFSDIADSPYRESIEFLYEQGVIQGYSDGTYRPVDPVNRAEMLKIILEAIEDDTIIYEPKSCFADVKDQWFAKYVCSAYVQQIVQGYPDDTFRPSQSVNMVEALKIGLETFDLSVDYSGASVWYMPYVNFAHQKSLFSKFNYSPERPMMRAEMAFFIHQLLLNQEGAQPLQDRQNNFSTGCGLPPPATPPSSSVVSGVNRTYITAVPGRYDPNTPVSLIFAWHGRTNPAEQVRGYYKVEEAAGDQAITVYPQGLPLGSGYTWKIPGDLIFFDQLLEELSSQYCIDLDKIYAVGHSNGAFFTNNLACKRGHLLRGVASLGGGVTQTDCTAPVAAMVLHNPADRLVSFSSGEAARDQYVQMNQCTPSTIPTEPSEGNCMAYQACVIGAPTVWCPHNMDYAWGGRYYPHTWPNFTGTAIWNFFQSIQ